MSKQTTVVAVLLFKFQSDPDAQLGFLLQRWKSFRYWHTADCNDSLKTAAYCHVSLFFFIDKGAG